jgi:outer membrane immunogenic protein
MASAPAQTTPTAVSATLKATAAYASAPPAYKAYPQAVAPSAWSGFYIGAHGGYTSGAFLPPCCGGAAIGYSSVSLSGGYGGLQAGYNYLMSPHWLFGVEQDISFGNISGSQVEPLPNPTISVTTKYSGTVRERFGYIFGDHALLYETAGLAWAVNKVDLEFQAPFAAQSAAETHVQYGVALGAGIEWAINPDLSVKVEYLYSYLTKEQYFSGTANGGLGGWPLSAVRAGVNWHLN